MYAPWKKMDLIHYTLSLVSYYKTVTEYTEKSNMNFLKLANLYFKQKMVEFYVKPLSSELL